MGRIIAIDMDYIVYLLRHTTSNCTYVGITNHPERRLRMHNGEIQGGARYTTMRKGKGEWVYHGCIPGLDKSTALSIERKIHNRRGKGKTPLDKRKEVIDRVLQERVDTPLEFVLLE